MEEEVQEECEAKVSGLSFDATQEDIKAFFEEQANCKVTNIKMLTMHDGRSKGVAFVKVGSRAALTSVLALHKAEHMGRWLNVEESFGAPNKNHHVTPTGADGANKEGDTVFVGNLSFTCTDEALRAGFESVGNIKAVRIAMRDGQPRGFGHVEFYDNESAKKACELAGTYVDGRPIRVDISEKRQNDGGNRGGRGGFRGGDRGGRGGFGGGRGGFRGGRGGFNQVDKSAGKGNIDGYQGQKKML